MIISNPTVLFVVTIFTLIGTNLARRKNPAGMCADTISFCPLLLDDVEPGYDFIRISVPGMNLKLEVLPTPSHSSHNHGNLECTQWECKYKIDNGPMYSDYLKFLKSPQTLFLLGTRLSSTISFNVEQCSESSDQTVNATGLQLTPGTALAGNEDMDPKDKEIILAESYTLLNSLLVEEFKRQTI